MNKYKVTLWAQGGKPPYIKYFTSYRSIVEYAKDSKAVHYETKVLNKEGGEDNVLHRHKFQD